MVDVKLFVCNVCCIVDVGVLVCLSVLMIVLCYVGLLRVRFVLLLGVGEVMFGLLGNVVGVFVVDLVLLVNFVM